MEQGMLRARTADVVIPLDDDSILVVDCLRQVLAHDREVLGRVIVVIGRGAGGLAAEDLDAFASDPRLVLIEAAGSYAGLANRGLGECRGDAVVLGPESKVGPGWLAELAAVAHLEERTACASPISNATDHGLSDDRDYLRGRIVDAETVKTACAPLPRSTTTPVLSTACVYFRGDLLPAVGPFDESLTTQSAVLSDWLARAQTLGFMAKRANHVYVPNHETVDHEEDEPGESSPAIIGLRHPPLERRIELFRSSLDCRMVDHAVRLAAGERLRLALDLRHLPIQMNGTRILAVSLAHALAKLPEIDLTLLVESPDQARGIAGRVVTADQWADDVQVIHRPAQVVWAHELPLLYRSSAHLVVTFLDLIAYRTPLVFSMDEEYESYQAITKLGLPAAQCVVAMSPNAAGEIAAEFAIPREEIPVVPLGVDQAFFRERSPRDRAVRGRLRLPARYFLSVATDFPHKNLHALLEAHEILRGRWPDESPPALILAGNKNNGRFGHYPKHGSCEHDSRVVILGPVSSDQLRVLYQDAIALVYPSLYEGFGLPPLEAMAAGTPVVAMPISSVPEVAGSAVYYARELSAKGLAEAMERIALDPALRENLRSRGLIQVEQFRWDRTARAMLKVYRDVVLNPSSRSLTARRLTSDAIIHWSERTQIAPLPQYGAFGAPPPVGIKNAIQALNHSVRARLSREFRCPSPSKDHGSRTLSTPSPTLRVRLAELLQGSSRRPSNTAAGSFGKWRADGRPVFLMVSHQGGGGTERHVREMAAALRAEGLRTIIVSPSQTEQILWEEHDGEGRLILRRVTPPKPKSIRQMLKLFRPAHGHIHHLLGLPHDFVDLLSEAEVRYDYSTHDYYAYCPRAHMHAADGSYCGEPEESACDLCITRIGDFFGRPVGESIASWRARSERHLSRARLIFVPSQYVRDRMERRFPGLPFVVRPYPENPPAMESLAARPRDGHLIRVAVIGQIAGAKGLKPLLECARDAEERGLPLEFVVVGSIQGHQETRLPRTLRVTGPYHEQEVYRRLAEVRCHLAFLPSVFPETFMYTLSIAMTARFYTVCFDIGAQSERLKSWGWGHVLPLGSEPSLINQSLLDSARRLQECGTDAPHYSFFTRYPDFLKSYYDFKDRDDDLILQYIARRRATSTDVLNPTPNPKARLHAGRARIPRIR